MFLQRTELLIGSDNIEKLKNSNVIVFGLGGAKTVQQSSNG